MKVTAIMATCGRHSFSERSLSLFLNQNYIDKRLLIYQNSNFDQQLDEIVDKNLVELVNCSVDQVSGMPYTNLGAIYRDALLHVSKDTDVIIFWDDDDLFLVNHIQEGIKGLLKSNQSAYKPAYSYFKDHESITLVQNNLEPSIFVRINHILKHGFSLTTSDQHLQWLEPLYSNNDIYIDEEGEATMIYNWGDESFSFKTSGDCSNPENFNNYRKYSFEHGDGIISPVDVSSIYKLIV